jgi:hypothetical protein
MLKKTFTYIDFNGNERTEDHYFNLTQAEALELEMSTPGGFVEMINRIVAAQDGPTIMEAFKDFVRRSYGRKSPDGRRFDKSAEIWEDFVHTEAYSMLFIELSTDAKKASEFINAVFPNNVKIPNGPVVANVPATGNQN